MVELPVVVARDSGAIKRNEQEHPSYRTFAEIINKEKCVREGKNDVQAKCRFGREH